MGAGVQLEAARFCTFSTSPPQATPQMPHASWHVHFRHLRHGVVMGEFCILYRIIHFCFSKIGTPRATFPASVVVSTI